MITTDVQKLAAGSIIDLFVIDNTAIDGTVLRFVADVNELNADITWQGNNYIRFPITTRGFGKTGKGLQSRPVITASNVSGLLGAFTRTLDDLIGAKFTRKRTFTKYLDAVNFAAGNAQADPNAHFVDEIWFIDRKVAENGIFMEFELSSALDLGGQMLPKRQITQSVCAWRYRSAECGFAGGPIANVMDIAVGTLADDVCGHRVQSCKLRFGANNNLPFGGFTGSGK